MAQIYVGTFIEFSRKVIRLVFLESSAETLHAAAFEYSCTTP
jgi:hypothetical protein